MKGARWCAFAQRGLGTRPPQLGTSSWMAWWKEDDDVQHRHSQGIFFYHIAAHSFRPYKPIMQELKHLETADDRLLLSQTGTFLELVEVLDALSLETTWAMSFLQHRRWPHPSARLQSPIVLGGGSHKLSDCSLATSTSPSCRQAKHQAEWAAEQAWAHHR